MINVVLYYEYSVGLHWLLQAICNMFKQSVYAPVKSTMYSVVATITAV